MQGMVQVYDLQHDAVKTRARQILSERKNPRGLIPEYGLIGSEEWWKAIRDGMRSTHTVEGIISRTYFGGASMTCDGEWSPDFPMFKVEDGSSRTQWQRPADKPWFVVG